MKQVYIVHYSEIGLKGGNRAYFEKGLASNIRKVLKRALPDQRFDVHKVSKRLLVSFVDEVHDEVVFNALRTVFGVENFGAVRIVPTELTAIEQECLELLSADAGKSFAIKTKRAFKGFPLTSPEVNRHIGARMVEGLGKTVNLTEPQITCHIEILPHESFVYTTKLKGLGGLPVGSNGRALVLLSGGFDSPVAAYFIMKRGARCEFIHFHSFPFTPKTSQEKVIELTGVLNKFQFKSRLFFVPFAETQKEIVFKCPDKLRIILYRRFMMRIAEQLAHRRGIKAIVTGESLGQVASQTLENIGAIEDAIKLPVLRPLIGLDKNEIIALARSIGTYEISARPHDDACTRFMPRQPEIHAVLSEVLDAEKELDIKTLVERDLEAIEVAEV